MDSRDSNVQQNHPTLCRNGCGFYSNAGNEGLCSVCYKDIVKKKQAPPTNMPSSLGPAPGSMASLSIDETNIETSPSPGRVNMDDARQEVVQTAINNSLDNDRAVEEVLSAKGKQQQELISSLLEDEKYQREIFQRLLLQQDDRNKEITDHLAKIQLELASLTFVELQKRDMKVEFEVSVMKEKREVLTKLLMSLLEQKKTRAEELTAMMKEMENKRMEDIDNYWMIQYQKLLDTKPKHLIEAEQNLDPQVKELLSCFSGDEFLPLFAKKNITMKQVTYMDDKALKAIGISSEYSRSKILTGVEEFLSKQGAGKNLPTAPVIDLDESLPSAPADEGPSAHLNTATPTVPVIPSSTQTEKENKNRKEAWSTLLALMNDIELRDELVYGCIRQSMDDAGLHREELFRQIKEKMSRSEMETSLEFLSGEGHIYDTVDENHFKVTGMRSGEDF